MSSRLLTRASPSRLKSSSKASLEPSQIPLPPSPAASDTHVTSDPFASKSSSPPKRPIRTSPRTKNSLNVSAHHDRCFLDRVDSPRLPSLSSTLTRTRPKRPRVVQDQFDSSSPPTSPTNRKSTRVTKRPKLIPTSPTRRSLRIPSRPDQRDTPNNPFLSKPGEKPRRADSRRDGGQRQLIYVFRGKRIPYDSTEDLDQTGGSPFNLSGPKLLFPSPPSPAPAPRIKFQVDEPVAEGSSSLKSPTRRSQHPNHLAFQTPKRDQTKSNLAVPAMLPTPQSRPRRTRHTHPNLSNQALADVVKSSRTMAKAMR